MSDTRFWGPPGWRFQNWIVGKHISNPFKNEFIGRFYCVLPFVLPCKYCRASLSQYIDEHPLTDAILADHEQFMEWIYTIHNCVNDKLRKQGLLHTPNPSFEDVKHQIYETIKHDESQNIRIPGWDFLYAIAHNLPVDDKPPFECINIVDEKHLHNLNMHHSVPYSERIDKLREFWNLMPLILPSVDAGHRWMEAAMELDLDEALETQHGIMKWLYTIHKAVELENQPSETYNEIFARVASHSSKCATSKKAITCRRNRSHTLNKTLKRK